MATVRQDIRPASISTGASGATPSARSEPARTLRLAYAEARRDSGTPVSYPNGSLQKGWVLCPGFSASCMGTGARALDIQEPMRLRSIDSSGVREHTRASGAWWPAEYHDVTVEEQNAALGLGRASSSLYRLSSARCYASMPPRDADGSAANAVRGRSPDSHGSRPRLQRAT